MNLNQRILFILLSVSLSMPVMMAQGAYNTTPKAVPDGKQSLSFEEALELLHTGNQSLKIADKGVEIAKSEKGKLNAFWYPSVQSTGAFVHMSEKIEVKQPLSQFTDPAKDFVHSIIPDDQIISGILDQIGANTLIFPLAPRNLTTVDVTAEWVFFAGGKRFHASKIGNTMVDLARETRGQVDAAQRTLLAESYYGLRLAQQVVAVREETYNGLTKHYENALKLEATGMIDKAARLFAQVNMDEAKRELEAARLIERRSNGFSKPNQIFLGVPRTAQKCAIEMVKNEQPDCSKVSNTIVQNCTPNQINKNNLRLNQLSRTKEAYGRYRNVFLEDYSKLEMEIAELDSLIDDLSIYMQSTGKKYADHAATLRSWSARKRKQQKPGTSIPDYTYNKEESL